MICVFAELAMVPYQEVPTMPQAHLSFPVISFQVVNKTSSTKPLVGINNNLYSRMPCQRTITYDYRPKRVGHLVCSEIQSCRSVAFLFALNRANGHIMESKPLAA